MGNQIIGSGVLLGGHGACTVPPHPAGSRPSSADPWPRAVPKPLSILIPAFGGISEMTQ